MNNNYSIDKINAYKENEDWYLSIEYTYENDTGKRRVYVPKAHLPTYGPVIVSDRDGSYIDIGFGELRMYRGCEETDKTDDTYVYKIDQLSTKTHKMTLKEIEAKLGYSIELVSEKEKE